MKRSEIKKYFRKLGKMGGRVMTERKRLACVANSRLGVLARQRKAAEKKAIVK